MKPVLIDSSVWIDYFRGSDRIRTDEFEDLIDNNRICVNDLILAELLPSLYIKKQNEIIDILKSVRNIPLKIDWQEIIELQKLNLKKGINNVGIPDLIIVQNIIQNDISIYSLDKHFQLMAKDQGFRLF